MLHISDKAEKAGFLAPSILKSLMGKEAQYQTEQATRSEDRKKTKRNYALAALGLVGGAGTGRSQTCRPWSGSGSTSRAAAYSWDDRTDSAKHSSGAVVAAADHLRVQEDHLFLLPLMFKGQTLKLGVTETLPKDVTGHQNYPAFRNFVQKHAQAGHSL